MKKTLAILLVALVALTSVFAAMETNAGSKTLTLVDTIGSSTTWKLQYKIGETGEWLDLDEDKIDEKSIKVDLKQEGSVGIQVLLDTNTSSALSRTFKITTTGFKRVEGDNRVDPGFNSTFTVTPKRETGYFSSSETEDGGITVSVDAYTRFNREKQVLESTLSWPGKSDLIAGNYEAVITVEYTVQ